MKTTVLGLIAGLGAMALSVFLVEGLGHILWPPPEGVDLKDPEQLKAIISTIPFGAKLFVMIGWAVGALVGGLVAVRISRKRWTAWVISAAMLGLTAITLFMIPHPVWMIAGAIAIPICAALITSRTAQSAD